MRPNRQGECAFPLGKGCQVPHPAPFINMRMAKYSDSNLRTRLTQVEPNNVICVTLDQHGLVARGKLFPASALSLGPNLRLETEAKRPT